MQIKLNGKTQKITSVKTLYDLIECKKLKTDGIVIERNGKILNKKEWRNADLKNNDIIEVISFVGGG